MAVLSLVLLASLFVVFYYTCVAIYRLFLHPLAPVPGPKLAALSSWYEIYWDCIVGGQYTFRVDEMHDKYGPIVRISPREVHIKDHDYWDILYKSARMDKDPIYYRGFGSDGPNSGMFSTPWDDVHRLRRGATVKLFSASNIAKLEPQIKAQVQRLFNRIEDLGKNGQPVPWTDASKSLTMDVISTYAEPRPARSMIDKPDFGRSWHAAVRKSLLGFVCQRHFRWFYPMLNSIPLPWLRKWDPEFAGMMDKRIDLLEQAERALASGGKLSEGKSMTVLETLVTSDILPPSDKNAPRLAEESESFLNAGTETTAGVLATSVFHVLSQPAVLARLKAELLACSPLPRETLLDSTTLNKLPYLAAVITESVRVASPVAARLPRYHPTRTYTYTNPKSGATYTFPPRTIISMAPRDMLADAEAFPDPASFVPERWLDSAVDPSSVTTAEERAFMNKCNVPFGTGSRNCVGMELAKQQMVLVLGNLFRRFDMGLWETGLRDVECRFDFFAPFPERDSEGVRLKVRS